MLEKETRLSSTQEGSKLKMHEHVYLRVYDVIYCRYYIHTVFIYIYRQRLDEGSSEERPAHGWPELTIAIGGLPDLPNLNHLNFKLTSIDMCLFGIGIHLDT